MKFYNPGTKLQDRLPYTHPLKDPKYVNTTSQFLLDIDEKGVIDVPAVLLQETDEGELTIPVNFIKRVKLQYRDRGLIMIDPRLGLEGAPEIGEDDNAAASLADAKVKGARMWKEYLRGIVTQHYTTVQEIKQNGGVPRAAKGLVVYALKSLGMEDPADHVDMISRAKEDKTSNDDMMAVIRELRDEVNQLKGAAAAPKA